MVSEVGAPPAKIDPQFLLTLTVTDGGSYGRNPKTTRRNQVENTRTTEKSSASLQAPKFLSQKAREATKTASLDRRISDVADALSVTEISSLKAEVPVMYRNVEIKYSKFGVDDFDFGHVIPKGINIMKLMIYSFYNRTQYSGLEIHIANSYANSLLQVMHFTPLIRNMALQHTSTACVNPLCLLCEMGFLFDMLEKAEGSICQGNKSFENFQQSSTGCVPF